MKRFVKTITVAAAGCAMVLGGAGIAGANCSGSHHGHGKSTVHAKSAAHGKSGHVKVVRGKISHSKMSHGKRSHGKPRPQGGGGYGYGHGHGHGHSVAKGKVAHSPGIVSGNVIQVPVHIPINLCGNSINVIGLLNPAFGNVCINK